MAYDQMALGFYKEISIFDGQDCIKINSAKYKQVDRIQFKTIGNAWEGLFVDILTDYRENISVDEYFIYNFGYRGFDIIIGDYG
jgi:hypothetical protein